MLGMGQLKEKIGRADKTIECPVKGCRNTVPKMTQAGANLRWDNAKLYSYLCPEHKIYISPSTFKYQTERDNLLWDKESDIALLTRIKRVKRECRFEHDNSEDAVTWNVFRFLETNNLICEFLQKVSGIMENKAEVIYWSYSQEETHSYSELDKARIIFGEEICKSSEPDIIVKTDKALLFIEAKLTAGNETPGKGKTLKRHLNESKEYITGGDNWFSEVFTNTYDAIVKDQKYELMRFWLIGSWMAKQSNIDFYLVNLVLSEREKDIEAAFKKHLYENQSRKFIRTTWEDIYQQILDSNLSGIDKNNKNKVIKYFENKTIGYDRNGKLQRAFSIS